MRLLLCTFLFVVGLIVAPTVVRAESRVALVIGNGAYQNVSALPNPVNDANDISAALKRLGFDVRSLTNAKYDDMRRALIGFGQRARGAEFAIIFFAGHGMEIAGENWLIPVDAQLATDLDVANETIGLQSLTRAVSNTTKLGLIILDACRNNPFLPKMQRTNLTRAVDRGFARVEPNDNVLVAYSAHDGTTANDGSGRNSPFTDSLLKNIETPGLEITFLFRNVRDDVMAATKRQQQPFVYGSLSKETIYLKPPLDTGISVRPTKGPIGPVAALTPADQVPIPAAPGPKPKITDRVGQPPSSETVAPVAQRAVLYDEDPSDPKGKQYVGTVVWRTEEVKGAAGKTPEIAVRADIDIPERKFKMTMSFRRNTDTSLPASHTAELTFMLPQDFDGGGVSNVPGILMKSNEQARGTPLAGLAVKVTDGFFLVGLSNVESDRSRNLELLKERSWFDVPLVYTNQRRAIITIEKGAPGERAYARAFASWDQ